MSHSRWCEHLEKQSKYVFQEYKLPERSVLLRIQTWLCPECGVHGAETEIVAARPAPAPASARGHLSAG